MSKSKAVEELYAVVTFAGDWSAWGGTYMPQPLAFIKRDGSCRLKFTTGNVIDGEGIKNGDPQEAIEYIVDALHHALQQVPTGDPECAKYQVHYPPEGGATVEWFESIGLKVIAATRDSKKIEVLSRSTTSCRRARSST